MPVVTRHLRCPACRAEIALPDAPPDPAWIPPSRARLWPLFVVGLLVIGLAVAGIMYRGHVLTALNLADEVTGSRTLTLIGVAASLILGGSLLAWLLFPIFVFWAYFDFRRHRSRRVPQQGR